MKLPNIRDLVPHTGAMVLLDRVISVDAENLCAEVCIKPETVFYDGQGVGAWVGIEYMAQAIAAHAGYLASLRGEPVKIGFLLGSRRYESRLPLFELGTVLRVHIHSAMQSDNGLGAFECKIVDLNDATGIAAVTATVTVFQPDNAQEFLHLNSQ